ncbi:MAG: GtrA family protein [bacterium]
MLSIIENLLVLIAKKYLNTNLKRYIVVGGLSYLFEMTAILLLKKIFSLTNVEAVTISYWIGLGVAFILQKIITFSNLDKRLHIIGKQVIIYVVLVLFNYSLNILAVDIFAKDSNVYLIRTLVILFCTLINFPVYKIIFSNKSNSIQNNN